MPNAFDHLLAAAKSRALPPVQRWHPTRVGSIDIRITANGDWYHEGDLIKRFAIAKLFATVLRLDDGEFYLVTPAEKLRIRVDDAPFVATGMETAGEGRARRILFTTNVGDTVVADATHPIVVEERDGMPRPYVEVRHGLRALITRSVFYRLVALAEQAADGRVSVVSDGATFVLGYGEDCTAATSTDEQTPEA